MLGKLAPRTIARTAPIAVLAVAAGLIAGCGSADETNAYVDEVNSIQQDAVSAVNAATSANATEIDDLTAQLDTSVEAIDQAITDLNGIKVPEDAATGHADLVAGLAEMSDLFSQASADVASAPADDPAALFGVVGELSTEGAQISTQLDAAINKINQDIGASG